MRLAIGGLIAGVVLISWGAGGTGGAASGNQSEFPGPVPPGRFRIATWNIRNFPEPSSDPSRVGEIIRNIDADVIAVQEIIDADALRAVLATVNAGSSDREYDLYLGSGGGDLDQLVGFIVDSSAVSVFASRDIVALQMSEDLRAALYARMRSRRGGFDFHALSVHLDSGRRTRDYYHRRSFYDAVGDVLPRILSGQIAADVQPDGDVVILGDLNTMGRDPTADVREVPAEEEIGALDARLVALGLRRLVPTLPCSEYYRGISSLLDHILVSAAMSEADVGAAPNVFGYCAVLRCQPFASGPTPTDFSVASDHCPVVFDLLDRDWD